MKIMLCKTLSGNIIPAYDEDKERLKRFKAGEPFYADVTKPRNLKFHKKAFALFNLVFQNQEIYRNLDDLRHDLTVEAGYYTEGANIHGELIKRAKSISFAAMDELEFSEYYDKIVNCIVTYFHFDKEELINEVSEHF